MRVNIQANAWEALLESFTFCAQAVSSVRACCNCLGAFWAICAQPVMSSLRQKGATSIVCVCMRSMWRIICLGFFGVFAWGMTWDMYGTRILEHYHRVVDAVQVRLICPFESLNLLSPALLDMQLVSGTLS